MILVIQLSANANEAKVFEAHAAPLALCDNLVNAKSIVTGLHLISRMGSEVDNHSAVDVGGLRRGTKSIHVKKRHFSEAFPEAVIREGADELTLRADEVGSLRAFIDTIHIELERW